MASGPREGEWPVVHVRGRASGPREGEWPVAQVRGVACDRLVRDL